jgi:cytochrome c peroxidase
MDLQGELGYAPFDGDVNSCSSECHDADEAREWELGNFDDFVNYHAKHKSEDASCFDCHNFRR